MAASLTVADRRFLLCSIAQRYTRISRGKYEVDELINEAWLDKNVRKAPSRKYLCMAGHWAMKRYMKSQERRWRPRKWTIRSLYDNSEYYVEPTVEDPETLLAVDNILHALSHSNKHERLLVGLRLRGWNMRRIARRFGVTGTTVRNRLEKIRKMLSVA
jgi:RNA polymerase sigma factor (sigma-70 family)